MTLAAVGSSSPCMATSRRLTRVSFSMIGSLRSRGLSTFTGPFASQTSPERRQALSRQGLASALGAGLGRWFAISSLRLASAVRMFPRSATVVLRLIGSSEPLRRMPATSFSLVFVRRWDPDRGCPCQGSRRRQYHGSVQWTSSGRRTSPTTMCPSTTSPGR